MKVRISQRAVYHKVAVVEIDIPDNIELDDVREYLNENEHLYTNEIEKKASEKEIEWGFGLGKGMEERDQQEEWRFDIDEEKIGGHL